MKTAVLRETQRYGGYRLPVPVRVRVEDGRPVRLTTDRHGLAGGPIVQAAGQVAVNHIYHDAEHPSHVVLPVLRPSGVEL